MAINCLELHEFCKPYKLEIIYHVLAGTYCLCMFVKYTNISKHIKLSHFYVPGSQCAQYYKREGNNLAYLFIYPPAM